LFPIDARARFRVVDSLVLAVARQRHLYHGAECGIAANTRQENRAVKLPEVLFGAPPSDATTHATTGENQEAHPKSLTRISPLPISPKPNQKD
jgi:hypothetical protein